MTEPTLKRRSAFPVDALVPAGGHARALLFENPTVNYPRDLPWRFVVNFERFTYRGEEVRPSVSIDWVRLPIRDWRKLVGIHVKGAYGFRGIEASFQLWQHYYADFELEVLERVDARFRIRIALTVEFEGWDGDDRDMRMPVSTEAWVPFWGIVLHPQVVDENPSLEVALRAIEPFADPSCYGPLDDGILLPKP